METVKNEKNIYFMLKIDNTGGYIKAVNHQGDEIDNFNYYNIKNENVKKIISIINQNKTHDFVIDWEKSTSNIYLNDFDNLILYLQKTKNFVNENFEPIVWNLKNNNLTLQIKNIENDENKLKVNLLLNKKYKDFFIISDTLIYTNGIIYGFTPKNGDLDILKNKVDFISKNESEMYLTLSKKYIDELHIDYMGYSFVNNTDIEGIPQITIEKISQDNSLYLKIDLLYSTMRQNFINENHLERIIIINHLEKKIYCSEPLGNLKNIIDDVTFSLSKYQKKLKKTSAFYVDDDNLIIITEKVAKEFVTKELLGLATKYKVLGTDKIGRAHV